MRARVGLAVLFGVVSACGSASPPPVVGNTSGLGAGAPEPRPPEPPGPPEPWFRDKPEAYDECVPASDAPAVPLPAPFDRCDGTEESWSSPPGGGELHFHYRAFSAAFTRARRAGSADVCCYAVWEFPRRH